MPARGVGGWLALRLEAADAAPLERMQGVVIDHLKRFAFREDLGEVQWRGHGGCTGCAAAPFFCLAALGRLRMTAERVLISRLSFFNENPSLTGAPQ